MATVGGALSADNTQDALNFVKAKIDSFLEDSKYAIKVLDEIGKIHPFIQGKLRYFSLVAQVSFSSSQWLYPRSRLR